MSAHEGDILGPFLAGDVMTGRGIDQNLRHPGDPRLFESWATSAADYVRLAEGRSSPIPRSVKNDYLWGYLLSELDRRRCDLRIINLETAITTAAAPAPKAINYRMNPANVGVLTAARIDACTLANNHVLDWGEAGLLETFETLGRAGIACAGAGRDAPAAGAATVLPVQGGGRALLLAFGATDSGVPPDWAASIVQPGINLLPPDPIAAVRGAVAHLRQPGDILIVSLHWGGNWGREVPAWQRELGRALIEEAEVNVVFGHSSHHPKAIETVGNGIVFYSCGDLINDYEGIAGHEAHRPNLGLGVFLDLDRLGGQVRKLELVPFERRRFRLQKAAAQDVAWLAHTLASQSVGLDLRLMEDGVIRHRS